MAQDDLEAAWDAVHEAMPSRWRPAPPTFDPGRQRWTASAIGPHPGRGRTPPTVTGEGEDETAALRDLSDRLRGIRRPDDRGRLNELRGRCMIAYIAGAEEWSGTNLGTAVDAE